MNDLLKKLNVLVKSTLHDALSSESPQEPLTPLKLGKDIDREVEQLRKRINEALTFEDQLQDRVRALQAEVEKWDKEADESVSSGNDTQARYAVEQMQRAEQRLTIAQSDLREHQLVTQELIMRVNTLDAAVADAHRSEKAQEQEPAEAVPFGSTLSDKLREVHDKINARGEPEPTANLQAPPESSPDANAVDDDLARRRKRLSKPE
jgi:phage shock protein A